MEAILNGVSGRSVTTRVGDPQSTGAEPVQTLNLPLTGSRVLETHSKPSLNVFGHAQRVPLMVNGETGVHGRNVLKPVEYQEEPF